MSNIFNVSRFGSYFLYDLRNARNYFWLSMLICGFFPIIVFVIFELLMKTISGEWIDAGLPLQISTFFIAFFIVFLTFPIKVYGSLTDKKAGSSWLMLPASGFEKWLSMIVITCAVVPACLFGLNLFSDWILGVAFPKLWTDPLLKEMADANAAIRESTEDIVSLNFPSIMYYSWVQNILCFTLGAIVFRKAKVGKTFLALFVIGTVLGWALALPFGMNYLNGAQIVDFSSDVEGMVSLVKNVNMMVGGSSIFYLVLAGGGLRWRIKTMKH